MWITDILLRTAPADYDKWVKYELKINSPQFKQAVQTMSDIWFKPGYTSHVRQDLNETYLWDVAWPMFNTPPQCWLLNEGSWITEHDGQSTTTAFSNKVFGKDYAFFLLPPIDEAYGTPVKVGGHFTAMFHDRPEVRALMEYFTTGAQLENWIKSGISFGFSPHKDAQPEWFTNLRERAIAEIIVAAQQSGNLRNPGGYWVWERPEVYTQFFKSISAYVNGDIDLDAVQNQIDAVMAATASP